MREIRYRMTGVTIVIMSVICVVVSLAHLRFGLSVFPEPLKIIHHNIFGYYCITFHCLVPFRFCYILLKSVIKNAKASRWILKQAT